MSIDFGPRVFQNIRPRLHTRIDFLEFGFITNDLYTIESFAKDTMQIKKLHVGNRGFQLFQDARLEDMIGLEIPYAVVCKETDRGNLRTLISLLKKTQSLQLDRMQTTWPILRVLCDNSKCFPGLKGLYLEVSSYNLFDFSTIPEELLGRLTELSLNEMHEKYQDDKAFMIAAR